MTELITFARETLPDLFAKGVEALREDGPADALEDVLASRGCVRFVVEGEGEVWLSVDAGAMAAHDDKPEELPPRMAFAFSGDDARAALELLRESGRLEEREAHVRLARSASGRAEKLLAGQKLEFHVIIRDVPDRDDVVIRVCIGGETPPEKPQFTAAISYDDIEDLREGDITPQQVIGRLRLTGDASRAMALGMMLMQPPKK